MGRDRRAGLYLVICRDGTPHMGEEPRLSPDDAEKARADLKWAACGPHRVVLYRPMKAVRRRRR
jgi:hypothetical protein